MLRYTDDEAEYYFVRFDTDGDCSVWYFDGESFFELDGISTTKIRLSPDIENHLSLKVVDSNIKIYANGEEILDLDDESITHSGQIGVGIESWDKNTAAAVEFDNLYVKEVP